MTEKVDCVVIGAGVVGLAVARRLALGGREVIVLEKAEGIGTETSSRNSEVIHAGHYYATGSLKARLCVAGNRALYRYCAERHVPLEERRQTDLPRGRHLLQRMQDVVDLGHAVERVRVLAAVPGVVGGGRCAGRGHGVEGYLRECRRCGRVRADPAPLSGGDLGAVRAVRPAGE